MGQQPATPIMDAGIRFCWWGNFKCLVASKFSSFFYFPTVFPLNGGAGTPTGETAASLKSTGRVPNGAQMSHHVYLSPPLPPAPSDTSK